MKRSDQGEVVLPATAVPMMEEDHASSAYRAGIIARRMANAPPKGNEPVAGGPTPPIPRLDRDVQGNGTMAQHAMQERRMNAGGEPVEAEMARQGGIIAEGPRLGPAAVPGLDIRATDILPEQAKSDPMFIEGQGSMFASNQPRLAAKYGVIRGGKVLMPHQITRQDPSNPSNRPGLRPETLKDIQALQDLEAQQQQVHVPAATISEGGRAAGSVGNVPGDDDPEPLSEADRKKVAQIVQDMDEFQYDAWRQAVMKDLLNNPGQKDILEAKERLVPYDLDIGDMVASGTLRQKVKIIPGKFEPTFEITDGQTDLALKRLIMDDSKKLEVSDRYYLDRFALMSMAAMLHSINNKPYPNFRDEEGNFDDERFMKRFNMVLKLPFPMLASLGINVMWFEMRVRKLFVAEKLGNG